MISFIRGIQKTKQMDKQNRSRLVDTGNRQGVFREGWRDDRNRGRKRYKLINNTQFQNKSQGCEVHIGNTVNNKGKILYVNYNFKNSDSTASLLIIHHFYTWL